MTPQGTLLFVRLQQIMDSVFHNIQSSLSLAHSWDLKWTANKRYIILISTVNVKASLSNEFVFINYVYSYIVVFPLSFSLSWFQQENFTSLNWSEPFKHLNDSSVIENPCSKVEWLQGNNLKHERSYFC